MEGVAEESNVHDGGDCGRSSCVRKFAEGRRVCGKTHIYIYKDSYFIVFEFLCSGKQILKA